MTGVVAGEMYLVGALGVRGTALAAGALNLLAAGVAGLVASGSASPGFADLPSGGAASHGFVAPRAPPHGRGPGPAAILRVGVPLMLPVSFVSGMFFPLVGAALRAALPSEIETAGVLTLVNTLGAALGSLVAGFILLPLVGIEKSFFIVALIYGG